jgi:type I restriction-modification system DNA methylase subunit
MADVDVERLGSALSLVDDAKTAVDPFMGSGTTLVAAKKYLESR